MKWTDRRKAKAFVRVCKALRGLSEEEVRQVLLAAVQLSSPAPAAAAVSELEG